MIGHREAEAPEALRTVADGRVPTAKSQAAAGGSGDLVLVLNSGSSSVKFALLNGFPEGLTGLWWPGCWITWPRPGIPALICSVRVTG
jgi:hypothetical protein